MKNPIRIIPLLILSLSLALIACSRQPQSTADLPKLISPGHRISVAPFTQPVLPSDMISGQLPENQGRITPEQLQTLDRDLQEILSSETNRQYVFLPSQGIQDINFPASGQPTGLQKWIAYGRKHNVDYLLVPQVINWNEREGSEAGVVSSAHVRLEFYLISIPQEGLVARSSYEEKQVGLIDNILTVAKFVKRKGQWVTANVLGREAITQAVQDLGL